MLSYRRETALQGALQFSPKVEDWNWETIFYGNYRSIFNHCDIIPYNFVPDSFHTAVRAEALRAKIDRKSAILHQRGHFDPKFLVQGSPPTNNF